MTLGSRAANLSGTAGRAAPSPAPPTLEAPPLAAIYLEFVVRDLKIPLNALHAGLRIEVACPSTFRESRVYIFSGLETLQPLHIRVRGVAIDIEWSSFGASTMLHTGWGTILCEDPMIPEEFFHIPFVHGGTATVIRRGDPIFFCQPRCMLPPSSATKK